MRTCAHVGPEHLSIAMFLESREREREKREFVKKKAIEMDGSAFFFLLAKKQRSKIAAAAATATSL